MKQFTRMLLGAALLALPFSAFAADTNAVPATAQDAYNDMNATLGLVPTFLKAFPEQAIPGAWAEMKGLLMGRTALDNRTKELIGLAVSAQIPCRYCSYYHEAAAKTNGATDQQIREAVAMAALVRHWSTVIDGHDPDATAFRREVDRAVRAEGRTARAPSVSSESGAPGALGQGVATGRRGDKQPGLEPPMRESPGMRPPASTTEPGSEVDSNGSSTRSGSVTGGDTRADIQRTLGFVPAGVKDFPDSALAGAWQEKKALEMSDTALTQKDKELIALGVAAQIPSSNTIYLHTQLAKKRGASQDEINETIAVASITRHWSTVLNGLRLDESQFQKETDQILQHVGQSKGR